MHIVDSSHNRPIANLGELATYFAQGNKAAGNERIGTEHELIGVRLTDGTAPPYAGGIGILLEAFAARGWQPIIEGDHIIALGNGQTQITIEPGGQFEYAGAPFADDQAFARHIQGYWRDLQALSEPLGITWLNAGMRPFGTRQDIPWMPKQRYDVMRAYMPTVGTRGLDMMQRTATVQTNLDYRNEHDAALKLRALYSVTSILTALYANSPIVDGQPSEFQSYRAWIWRDTDNARCGLLPFVFERDDLFTAYRDWALDVPMYFIHREAYIALPAGMTFRDYFKHGHAGQRATLADWALHLSTLFPEVRLKHYLEVRGADCGSPAMITALPALTRAICYDADTRAAAIALTQGFSMNDRNTLADDVPRLGLAARAGRHRVSDLASELVTLAKLGLARTAPEAASLLAPLEEIVATDRTPADALRERWTQAATVADRIQALAFHA